MAREWQIGERIGNRLEVHPILRGGMGIVYIIYEHDWHEAFASKTYREEVTQPLCEIRDVPKTSIVCR